MADPTYFLREMNADLARRAAADALRELRELQTKMLKSTSEEVRNFGIEMMPIIDKLSKGK